MAKAFEGSVEEARAMDTYVKLLRASQSVKARVDGHDCVPNLSESQFGALEAVYHLGPLPQKSIGEKLLVSKSNVVGIVDALEACDFVQRQRDLEDRRIINVKLLPAGRDYLENTMPVFVDAVVEEMNALTAEEQSELARLLRKLGRKEIG